jgi:hypothetical protein
MMEFSLMAAIPTVRETIFPPAVRGGIPVLDPAVFGGSPPFSGTEFIFDIGEFLEWAFLVLLPHIKLLLADLPTLPASDDFSVVLDVRFSRDAIPARDSGCFP